MSNDKRRAMMAADVCERASIAFRGDVVPRWNIELAIGVAANLRVDDDPCARYRAGLTWLCLTPEAIDAAVAAIARGEWPADSLAGRLLKMRTEARGEWPGSTATRSDGTATTLDAALALLGVKP